MDLDDILKDTNISMNVVEDIVYNCPPVRSLLAESLKDYAEGSMFASIAAFREAMRLMQDYAKGKQLTMVGNRQLLR